MLLDSPDEVDPKLQYRAQAIVGSLIYLYQLTRPDPDFAVTFLSRYFISLVRNIFKHLNMFNAI
jgi:hypothetical protein